MSQIVIVISCFVVFSFIVFPSYAFRSDYTFVESSKGYYKYHSEGGSWSEAILNCQSEGAQLFYPEDETEVTQVISVLKAKNSIGYDIMIGISDLRKNGVYETVDGRSVSEVYNNWRKDEPYSGDKNEFHCAYVDIKRGSHKLFVYSCEAFYQPYICKFKSDDVTSTAASEIHPIHKAIEEIKKLFVEAGKTQLPIIERQTAALERQAEAMQRQAHAIQMIADVYLRGSPRRTY